MESALWIGSGGERLAGILNVPPGGAGSRPDVGFVFVHSGSRGRLGNTFHYPFMARALAERGIPSLRFDPYGVGDSTGTIAPCKLDDYYGSIERGRYVADTLAAVAEFDRRVSPRRIFLLGTCGGAITALLAGARTDRVAGLVLLSVPVMLDSSEAPAMARLPSDYARKYLFALYGKKLFSPRAWLRLFTLRSEIRTIGTYLWAVVRGRGAPKRAAPASPDFNPEFQRSLDAVTHRRGRVLLVFGTHDPYWLEFKREFADRSWDDDPAYARQCEVKLLEGCNHMFTMRKWQREVVDAALAWTAPSVSS